jgi:hypothetical protein
MRCVTYFLCDKHLRFLSISFIPTKARTLWVRASIIFPNYI